jgi:chromosome segregation ATPase
MSHVRTVSHEDRITCATLTSAEERERSLIEAVVALARSLRDERDRLAARLREVERELNALAAKLNARGGDAGAAEAFSGFGGAARADRPPRPSRTRV